MQERATAKAMVSRLPLWPVAIFAVVAALFALALRSGDPSRLPSALIGRPAPAIALPAIEGTTSGGFSTASLATGKPVVVNFWASWCEPCVQEHAQLVALKERTGVQLYGINYKDKADAARKFLERLGDPFVAVGADLNGRAGIEWGVIATPETFVLNGKGEIVYKHTGPISAEALQSKIIPAILAASR